VLPGMRERRSGTIVNLSSIGAARTGAGSGYYGAVKAAIEQMTMALRTELEPLGIVATVVAPGSFRTDFSGRSLTQSSTVIDDYAETAGKRRKENDTTDGTQPNDPALGAKVLVDAVEQGAPFYLLLGGDAVEIVTGALDDLRADVDAWAERSRSTAYDAS
jgi:NAD(P)-dependent dehydrogenase (short-subunit alcohol dehydrogenase family)